MTLNQGFHIALNLQGRSCVVIGGEDEASHKTALLLDGGAKVVVVSPALNAPLRTLTASGKILHRGRRFRSSDTQGAFLILNTLPDADLAASLRTMAETERFLVWSMDRPDASNVMMPAVARRGSLRLAISTGGASPALARALRRNCEEIFDEEFARFVEWLAALREDVRANEPGVEQRKARLQGAVEGFRLTGRIAYPRAWLERTPSSDS